MWGDGLQTRSFMLVDYCVVGIIRLFGSDCDVPINSGSDEVVSMPVVTRTAPRFPFFIKSFPLFSFLSVVRSEDFPAPHNSRNTLLFLVVSSRVPS